MEQTPKKTKILKRVLEWVLLLLVLLFFLATLLPSSGPGKMGDHLYSWNNMKQIAHALNQYQQEHNGVVPWHLSELVPDYVSEPKMFFIIQSKYTTSTCVMPANLDSHPELIDLFSPYSFAVLPDKRILVWERPGMWIDNTMRYFVFPDDNQFSDTFQAFRSNSVTAEEFEQRFLHGFH